MTIELKGNPPVFRGREGNTKFLMFDWRKDYEPGTIVGPPGAGTTYIYVDAPPPVANAPSVANGQGANAQVGGFGRGRSKTRKSKKSKKSKTRKH